MNTRRQQRPLFRLGVAILSIGLFAAGCGSAEQISAGGIAFDATDCVGEISFEASKLEEPAPEAESTVSDIAAIADDCADLDGVLCVPEGDNEGNRLLIRREGNGFRIIAPSELASELGESKETLLGGSCKPVADSDARPPIECTVRAGALIVDHQHAADEDVANDAALLATKHVLAPIAGTADLVLHDGEIGDFAVITYTPHSVSPVWLASKLKHFGARPVHMVGSTNSWAYSPSDAPVAVSSDNLRAIRDISHLNLPDPVLDRWRVVVYDTGWAAPGQPLDKHLVDNPDLGFPQVPSYVVGERLQQRPLIPVADEPDLDPFADVNMDTWQDWVYGHGTFVAGVIAQLVPVEKFHFIRPEIRSNDERGTPSFAAGGLTPLGPAPTSTPGGLPTPAPTLTPHTYPEPTPTSFPDEYSEVPKIELAWTGELHVQVVDPVEQVVVFDELQLINGLLRIAELLESSSDLRPIVNMSMGFYPCSPETADGQQGPFRQALDRVMTEIDEQQGFFVAAAGNEKEEAVEFHPAGLMDEFARGYSVGSVTSHGQVSDFSNRGDWVEIYSQGDAVTSAFPWLLKHASDDTAPNGVYTPQPEAWAKWSGTSFAAPCIAAWLMFIQPPTISALTEHPAAAGNGVPYINCWESKPYTD